MKIFLIITVILLIAMTGVILFFIGLPLRCPNCDLSVSKKTMVCPKCGCILTVDAE